MFEHSFPVQYQLKFDQSHNNQVGDTELLTVFLNKVKILHMSKNHIQ